VMKPNLFRTIRRGILVVTGWVLLLAFSPSSARAAQFNSFAEAVSGSYFLTQQPFLWVGAQPPDESESRDLWLVLDNWRSNGYRSGASDLELFLQTYTNSPWAASLHANLGNFYRDHGRITPALEHWAQAWVLTRQYPQGAGKLVGDYTLAQWTRLLASLGRYETLAVIFQETQGRVVDA